MKEKFYHENVSYITGDFNNLIGLFKENDIDFIIEKAGLDTICTLKDESIIQEKLNKVFNQIYFVLKPGGYIATISNQNFDFWERNIHNKLVENKMFTIEDRQKSVSLTSQENNVVMNYYFYLLKKTEKHN